MEIPEKFRDDHVITQKDVADIPLPAYERNRLIGMKVKDARRIRDIAACIMGVTPRDPPRNGWRQRD